MNTDNNILSLVKVKHSGIVSVIEVEEGSSLLEAVGKIDGVHFDATCGGAGTCGKCKLKILKGDLPEPTDREKKLLGSKALEDGFRLSCMVSLSGPIEVFVDDINEKSQIITSHNGFKGEIKPLINKKFVKLPIPSLDDQRDDLSRLIESVPLKDHRVSLSLRQKLPRILRDAEYSVTAVFSSQTLLTVEPENTEHLRYGIAVDIGTTTIASYLIDKNSGEIIDSISGLNTQKIFGADVISRIEFCMQDSGNLEILQNKILTQIGDICVSLAENNGISIQNIYSLVLAGNTTMLHLAYGIDPSGIASAPFIPGVLSEMCLDSSSIESFPLNSFVYSLPSISGYVGADIVAGILATDMYKREELTLLIDIGTNGEIVLGNKDKLYCCSTAAGPAFEGAHISCGIGGIAGAVDSAVIDNGAIKYTTIKNAEPIGICGSGIIDLVAVFLTNGIVDFTGRILDADEIDSKKGAELSAKLLTEKDGPAFLVVKASETGLDEDIYFTQQDIREVQLAKAAISAGVATLLKKAGRELDEIKHFFLAGGFGNYISKESAASIGLIPAELLERTESVGNTAGQGSLICTLSQDRFIDCRKIIKLTDYIELSSDSYFQLKYMEDMVFPEY